MRATTAHFYDNGVLVETVTGSLPTELPLRNFTIGNQSPGFGHTDEYFFGGLAGIYLYDTALTSEQILAQFNASLTPVPESTSLALVGLAALGAGGAWLRRRSKANAAR